MMTNIDNLEDQIQELLRQVEDLRDQMPPLSAVATEGGGDLPAATDTGTSTFKQKLAAVKGDLKAERAVLDAQWEVIDKLKNKEIMKQQMQRLGMTPEDLA